MKLPKLTDSFVGKSTILIDLKEIESLKIIPSNTNIQASKSQITYEGSLSAARNYFSFLRNPKGTITKLPVDLKTVAKNHQTSNYWLPALQHVYGSLENFLFCTRHEIMKGKMHYLNY